VYNFAGFNKRLFSEPPHLPKRDNAILSGGFLLKSSYQTTNNSMIREEKKQVKNKFKKQTSNNITLRYEGG
jgi:hypothetical protein